MKKLKFGKVKTGIKDTELNVPIELVMQATNLVDLQKMCAEVQGKAKPPLVFDYRVRIKDFYNSQGWGSKHPLQTPEDLQTAMDVNKVLSEGGEVVAEDKIVDLICDVVAEISYSSLGEKMLPIVYDFKKYFEELKESKGEPIKKGKK